MSFHILFNALIILFILHIFLQNVQFHKVIGTPKREIKEGFEDKKKMNGYSDTSEKDSFLKSLQFLEDKPEVSDQDDDFKKKLLSFIEKSDDESKYSSFEQKNVLPTVPANSFTQNYNEPNFESNVLNVQKFYHRNFDSMDAKELEKSIQTSYPNIQVGKGEIVSTQKAPIPNLSTDVNDNRSTFGRISTENPPTWTYKNELPMNGGSIGGGIVGFDCLESQFSQFAPATLQFQPSDSNNFQTIPHDDLRKPIIYEN